MSLEEFDEITFTHSAPRLDSPSPYLLKKARRRGQAGIDDIRASYKSCTVYVGNLSFYTTEEQIYELFGKAGFIKKIIMGLDRFRYTPCGFCFVIYYTQEDALNAIKFLNGTKLEDRILEIDLDPGFEEGRQFGRGQGGGQVRDEIRSQYDSARGGYGNFIHDGQGETMPAAAPMIMDTNMNNVRFGARRVHDVWVPGQTEDGDGGVEQTENTRPSEEGDTMKDDDDYDPAANEKTTGAVEGKTEDAVMT